MPIKKIVIVFSLFVLFPKMSNAAVVTCNSCSSCRTQISGAASGDTVQLASDVSDSASTCISFNQKSGITLDCQGREVVGPYSQGIPPYIFGIQLTSSSNNTIRNCRVRNYYDNISLESSSGNTFDNITTNTAFQNGFYFHLSSSNTITNSTANDCNSRGIYLYYTCQNNTITNTTTNSNTIGMSIEYSTGNVVDGATVVGNDADGISIAFAQSNTIRNSHIENNASYGLYFPPGFNSKYVRYNTIYNNYLSNNVNLYTTDANNQPNYFNETLSCSSGTNIAGGPCKGGNFWTKPSGTDFSDTCADTDRNGICDSAYSPYASNTDNYPLATYTPDTTPPLAPVGFSVR